VQQHIVLMTDDTQHIFVEIIDFQKRGSTTSIVQNFDT
jgi:hypothetical protein